MTHGERTTPTEWFPILRRIRTLLWVQAGLGVAAVAAHLLPLAMGMPHLLLPARSLLGPTLATASAIALLLTTRSNAVAIRTPGLLALASLPVLWFLLAVLPPGTTANTAIGWVTSGRQPDAWRLDLALHSAAIAAALTLGTLLTAVISFGSLCLPATRTALGHATHPNQHRPPA